MKNEKAITVGSVCSGIEAASVAWSDQNWDFKWFSEIEEFPSKVLSKTYPDVENLGDMTKIPKLIKEGLVFTPDLICAGTPCQAFSLAGTQKGLDDDRGNLTLSFVELIEANDNAREAKDLPKSIVFWENVEGVLSDRTNAFGCLISSLAGLSHIIDRKKWPKSGVLEGPLRNIAWRVLDTKYFGLPQQRKRLYLLAGGKDFDPSSVLFEQSTNEYLSSKIIQHPSEPLEFIKNNIKYQVFRDYTDCLYSAYGTKWNGNAAAYNGSLFVVQDDRIRRLTPLECERLMGFSDNYTLLDKSYRTNRYKAVGNSWAVPVIKWLGKRILSSLTNQNNKFLMKIPKIHCIKIGDSNFYDLQKLSIQLDEQNYLNCSEVPNNYVFGKMSDIVSDNNEEKLYLSPTACAGILRRKEERSLGINKQLEEVLARTAKQLPPTEIEKRSRVQKRGRFSEKQVKSTTEQFTLDGV